MKGIWRFCWILAFILGILNTSIFLNENLIPTVVFDLIIKNRFVSNEKFIA